MGICGGRSATPPRRRRAGGRRETKKGVRGRAARLLRSARSVTNPGHRLSADQRDYQYKTDKEGDAGQDPGRREQVAERRRALAVDGSEEGRAQEEGRRGH